MEVYVKVDTYVLLPTGPMKVEGGRVYSLPADICSSLVGRGYAEYEVYEDPADFIPEPDSSEEDDWEYEDDWDEDEEDD